MLKRTGWSRYLSQAQHTLASARRDMDDGDFAWACLKSPQSATSTVPEGLAHCARELDNVCIPTRYSDVCDAGSPHEYFDHRDAAAHVECPTVIVAHHEAEVPHEPVGG